MGFLDWLFGHSSSDPRRTTSVEFRENLMRWATTTNISKARKFLENHLELLRPESEQLLEIIIRGFAREGDDSPLIDVQKTNSTILSQAIAAGGTHQAVRDAYIDEFGAMSALDLPPWLAVIRKRIIDLRQHPGTDPKPLIQEAITRAHDDHSLEPEILATLQFTLGAGLIEKDPSSAVELLESAAKVFIPRRFPKKSAETQKFLSRGYLSRAVQDGNEQDFLQAIPCIEAALRFFTTEKDLEEWIQLHIPLSMCHVATGNIDRGRQVLEDALALLPASAPPNLIQMVQEPLRKLEAMQRAMDEQEQMFDMIEMRFPDVARRLRNEILRPSDDS